MSGDAGCMRLFPATVFHKQRRWQYRPIPPSCRVSRPFREDSVGMDTGEPWAVHAKNRGVRVVAAETVGGDDRRGGTQPIL